MNGSYVLMLAFIHSFLAQQVLTPALPLVQALVQARARSDSDATCTGSIDLVVTAGPAPPPGKSCGKCTNNRCFFGPNKDVKPCCRKNQMCFKTSRNNGVCLTPSRAFSRFEKVACTKK